jgi:hypothetical protein
LTVSILHNYREQVISKTRMSRQTTGMGCAVVLSIDPTSVCQGISHSLAVAPRNEAGLPRSVASAVLIDKVCDT